MFKSRFHLSTKFSQFIGKNGLKYSTNNQLSHPTLDSLFMYKLKNTKEFQAKVHNLQIDEFLKKPLENFERLNEIKKISSENLVEHLDSECVSKLKSFNTDNPACEMIIIKNFPFTEANQADQAEQILLGLSFLLKMSLFTYENEYNGRLLHHIRPRLDAQYLSHSASSKAELKLHTENSFDKFRPDYQALYCLKGNLQAMTTYLSVSRLLKSFTTEKKSEMLVNGMKNNFLHITPASHSKGLNQKGELFYRQADNSIGIRYGHGLINGLNDESEKLLKELEEKMFLNRGGIVLEDGDLCIWSNHTVLHGRSAYKTS